MAANLIECFGPGRCGRVKLDRSSSVIQMADCDARIVLCGAQDNSAAEKAKAPNIRGNAATKCEKPQAD